jgi:hypothetical protein
LLLCLERSAFGAFVTGTVTDKTTNQPSAGDDVVLISLAQRMQETGRTKTDASGNYRMEIADAGMHLIRVDHQKAAYFAALAPGAIKVDGTVYDVTPKIEGLSMEADMARIDTDDRGLHVVESYFLKNESTPPRTQFSPKAFDVYLPFDAKVNASIAMGPGGMPVASAPVPLGDPGHYAFVFPIRPGETRFQVEYHIPESESHKFRAQVSVPTSNYAGVLPESMTFIPGSGGAFRPMRGDPNMRTLLAKNVAPGKAVTFTVSGHGTFPQTADRGQAGASASSAPDSGTAAPDNRPGGGMAAPIDTPDPLDKYKFWIISGIGLALAIAAGILLRSKPAAGPPPADCVPLECIPADIRVASRDRWIAALNEELFTLETDRIRGAIFEEEYVEQKRALDILMKRAIARSEDQKPLLQQSAERTSEARAASPPSLASISTRGQVT